MDIKYEIFVDMDGVLVDFAGHTFKMTSVEIDHPLIDKESRNRFWKTVTAHVNKGGKFFEDMPAMPDAMVLWEYVSKYNPVICSASGHLRTANAEKRAWLRARFGHEVANSAIIVPKSEMKAIHAAPHRILIDDRMKSLGPWTEAGGLGILHTSAEDTIKKLKEMGL
jgi:5'(3')-deoxyribonucleotidase